jgi:hypothetical protein
MAHPSSTQRYRMVHDRNHHLAHRWISYWLRYA